MRILVSERIAETGIRLLREEHEVDTFGNLKQKEMIKIIPKYDALVLRGDTIVDSEIIEAGINLKVIGRAGLEVDNIDIQTATKRGIIVLNAPQENSASSVEYTMGMLLALSRKIVMANKAVISGKLELNKLIGTELREKTLGIAGLGRVGAGVACRAKAFDMRVLAYDPFICTDKARELGVELVEREILFKNSDYISLHLPITVDTRHFLNKKAFSQMKKGVKIINCATGGTIDEKALLWALQEGIVSGAALDAFEEEPVSKEHSLINMENVICTPHIASSSQEAENEIAIKVARGVLASLRSEPAVYSLNSPSITKDLMKIIKPYISLMEKMVALAVNLNKGNIINVEVKYNGEISALDTKILTLTALKAILNPILEEEVNYVNALEIAKERGISVKEIKSKQNNNFVNLITLTVGTDKSEHSIAGTLFGTMEGRIVGIDEARVDIEPAGCLLIIPHEDYPGMVGKVGTLLGQNNINITSMQVGMTDCSGKNIMIVGVQTEIPSAVISRLQEMEGIIRVTKVHFEL